MSLELRRNFDDGLHTKDKLNTDRRMGSSKTDEELVESLKVAFKKALLLEPNAKFRLVSLLRQKQKIYDAKQRSFQTGWGGHSENPNSFQDAMVSINMEINKNESDRLKFAIDGSSHDLSPSRLLEATIFHTILTSDATCDTEEEKQNVKLENEGEEDTDIERQTDTNFVERIIKLMDSGAEMAGLSIDQQDQTDSILNEEVADSEIDRNKTHGIQIGTIQIDDMESIAGASYFFKISQSTFNGDAEVSDELLGGKRGGKRNLKQKTRNDDDENQNLFKTIYIDCVIDFAKVLSTMKPVLIPVQRSEIQGGDGKTIKIQFYEKFNSEKSDREGSRGSGKGRALENSDEEERSMGNVRLMGEYEISLSDFFRKVKNSLKKDTEVTDVTGLKVATTENEIAGGETGKGRLNCKLTLAGRKKGVVFVSDIAFSLLNCSIIGDTSTTSSTKPSRRLGTWSESEGAEEGERILVSDFIVGIITTVLGNDVTSKAYERWLAGNEMKDREQVKESETPRLRRTLRQRAQRDGNMGGKQVLSREDAAVTLQAAWRSKWVRRCTRRKDVCAVAIQRIVRGYLQRLRCGSDLVRAKDRRKEEIERLARLRRIRAKERELALLRKVPVASYLTMEKLRQDCSAKVLQRAFRSHLRNTSREHLIPESKGTQYRATYLSGMLGGIGKQGGLAEAKKEAARKALRKEGVSGLFGAPSDEKLAKKILEENAQSERIKNILEKMTVSAKVTRSGDTSQRSAPARRVDMDTLALAQLQRRIKDAAQIKAKARAREKEGALGYRTPNPHSERKKSVNQSLNYDSADTIRTYGGIDGVVDRVQGGGRGGVRRRYQDLAEMQQKAAILLDDFHSYADVRKYNQTERLRCLKHCALLKEQLSSPPCLDDGFALLSHDDQSLLRPFRTGEEKAKNLNIAEKRRDRGGGGKWGIADKGDKKDNDKENYSRLEPLDVSSPHSQANLHPHPLPLYEHWLEDLPTYGLNDAIDLHTQTIGALTNKSKWSLVAVPQHIAGPPVDIAALTAYTPGSDGGSNDRPKVKKCSGSGPGSVRLANAWADGEGAEDSLYWVTYAVQPSRKIFRTIRSDGTQEDAVAPAAPSASQKVAEAVLGEVDGQELLQFVSKEYMSSTNRRTAVKEYCEIEGKRLSRLADMFAEEALVGLKKQKARNAHARYSEEERGRREYSACVIQRNVRGNAARKAAAAVKAESRVVTALQTLLLELSKPESKGGAGKSILQMDPALLYRLASINQQPSKTRAGTIYPVSKKEDPNPSKASRTFEKTSHPSQPYDTKEGHGDKYSDSQAAEQQHTRHPTQPLGTRTQDLFRRPPTRPGPSPFLDSPGSCRDSRHGPGSSSAISTPDTESSKYQNNHPNLNLSISVSPNEASSKFENEMQNFSPKGIQSGRQGWGPGTNSRDPIQSPRNMTEEENVPWNSSRAVGNNDVPEGFQLNRTVERFNPHTREPKSSKKKKKDPNRPLSPMQESVDESPVVESRVPRSVDYDTGMRRSKYQGDVSHGRGHDRGQGWGQDREEGRGQGRGNHPSEHSGREMKIDGPWHDDEGEYASSPSSSNVAAYNLASGWRPQTLVNSPFMNISGRSGAESATQGSYNPSSHPTPVKALSFSAVDSGQGDSTGGGGYYINDEGVTADDIQGKHQQRAQHGDDDDDEGVARGSVGGQRRSSGRGSSGDAAHTALSIGLPSALVLDAMRDVTMRFHSKECKVSALIDSALGADPSNFKKASAMQLLQELVMLCGVNPLSEWLSQFQSDTEDTISTRLPSTKGGGREDSNLANQSEVELQVEVAACVMGELAGELCVLDRSELRSYCTAQLCILLRLLAGATESSAVRLSELTNLLEDSWLSADTEGDLGPKLNHLLATVRFGLLQKASRNAMSPRDHFNSVLAALHSSKQSSADRILSVSDVALLLGSCVGLKSTNSINSLSLSVGEEEALSVIRFCVWDESACSMSVDQLRSFLCALPTYRVLQKRLQTWFRAVPKMYSSIIQTDAVVEAKMRREAVTHSAFCTAIHQSETPLTPSEGFMLAHLLGRGPEGVQGSGRVVDISLLARIKKADFLNASSSE